MAPSSSQKTQSPSSYLSNASGESESQALTKLGQISFINTLPVVIPLMNGAIEPGFEMVFGTPAELNRKLENDELKIGAMSSFYFLQDGRFELVPNLSIAGVGKVGSVLLFSKDELKGLDGKIIDVPNSSATSIKLMQVLLKEEFGVEPIIRTQLNAIDFKADARATLFIGDKALNFDASNRTEYRIDLATWWYERFNLPFVFGVWGARRDWAERNRRHFTDIGGTLVNACKLGLSSQLLAVIAEGSKRTGMSDQRLKEYYLNELDYRLTEQHLEALKLFEALCSKHGHLNTKI